MTKLGSEISSAVCELVCELEVCEPSDCEIETLAVDISHCRGCAQLECESSECGASELECEV